MPSKNDRYIIDSLVILDSIEGENLNPSIISNIRASRSMISENEGLLAFVFAKREKAMYDYINMSL